MVDMVWYSDKAGNFRVEQISQIHELGKFRLIETEVWL